MRRTSDYTDLVEVEVDCPDCGNLNREARRWCKKHKGTCGGSGRVMKMIPKAFTDEGVDGKIENLR